MIFLWRKSLGKETRINAMQKISFKQKIVLVLFGVFLSLIMLEIGMRLGGFVFLSMQDKRSVSSIKEKGEYRILCLGESTTIFGGRISYPYQLEEILNQSNIGIKFKVINKGTPGIDTSYIASQLEHNLKRYKPDMVIAMMGINDAQNLVIFEQEVFSKILKHFRVYKLIRNIWPNILAKKKDMHKYEEFQIETSPKKAIKVNLEGAVNYFELGLLYRDKADFNKAEEFFKKAMELNQLDDISYFEVGRFYRDRGLLAESEEAFKKALELNPQNDFAYLGLGWLYSDGKRYLEAEGNFKKAAELNPKNKEAQIELGWCYRTQGKLSQAEGAFKKAIELNSTDDKLYSGLAVCYNEQKKYDLAQKYFKIADGIRSKYYCPFTYSNYHKIKKVLDKSGIKLVCVQYPMRSVEPLKRIFEGQQDVLFVDNEKIFKDALKQSSYKEYFVDAIAGDFGHCTYKGNELLAGNIANVILKKVFGK